MSKINNSLIFFLFIFLLNFIFIFTIIPNRSRRGHQQGRGNANQMGNQPFRFNSTRDFFPSDTDSDTDFFNSDTDDEDGADFNEFFTPHTPGRPTGVPRQDAVNAAISRRDRNQNNNVNINTGTGRGLNNNNRSNPRGTQENSNNRTTHRETPSGGTNNRRPNNTTGFPVRGGNRGVLPSVSVNVSSSVSGRRSSVTVGTQHVFGMQPGSRAVVATHQGDDGAILGATLARTQVRPNGTRTASQDTLHLLDGGGYVYSSASHSQNGSNNSTRFSTRIHFGNNTGNTGGNEKK
ncbi:hypothetical protein ACQ4LE_009840 [Meloidogyne hapla]|uniref:Uncharacterized protein n=1 Tax=Meloidogyne hapla TaxID=6305 RepID=A0A1I8BX03_MELHA